MLVVAGRIRVKPDRREEAVKIALEVAQATRAEPGCISYRFYGDLEDASVFFVFEEWQNEEALATHFTMPHMATFAEAIPGLVAGPLEITRYEVAASAAM